VTDSSCFCDLHADLPATLTAVEEFVLRFRSRTQSLLRRPEQFAIELLLRELLCNAVVHGCGQNPDLRVRCSVRQRPKRFTLAVCDDGRGFDWRSAWRQPSVASDCSGRGIEILRTYATRVRFNQAGNQAFIVKELSNGEIR
jgi:anti-sigma regulatory factor (Ser/Thr protein kinase)